MPPTIKISDAKLAEIRLLRDKFQQLHQKFGTLYLERMELDSLFTNFLEREKNCKEEWTNLQKLERGLLDDIVKTYGEGSLNMENGTFSPTNSPGLNS